MTASFHRGDTVGLLPGVAVAPGMLMDPIRRSAIPLNGSAATLTRLLSEARPVSELVDKFAEECGAGNDVAGRDVLATLDQLDALYLLRTRRDWRSRLTPTALAGSAMSLMILAPARPPAWSRPGSLLGVVAAVSRAAAPHLFAAVLLIPALLTVMMGAGALESLGLAAISYTFVPAALLLIALTQFTAHEYAHYWLSKRWGGCPFVVQRGTRVFITHRRLTAGRRRIVAAGGPLAGAVFGALQAAVLLFLGSSTFAWVALAVGAAQVVSLLPFTADGRMFWRVAPERAHTAAAGATTEEEVSHGHPGP